MRIVEHAHLASLLAQVIIIFNFNCFILLFTTAINSSTCYISVLIYHVSRTDVSEIRPDFTFKTMFSE